MPFLSTQIIRDLFANRPAAGSSGRLFFSSDTGKTYRDNGATWDDVSDASAVTSVAGRTGAVTLAEADISGLTADLAAKAPLASPGLTGTPTAPTAASTTNTTQIATTAFVQGRITDLINAAPTAFDTLGEIATQLASDESAAAALTTAVAAKAPSARTISTTAPLTGGGDLSADRTLSISNFVGDTGSGGTAGAVPAPAAGDAAAGKFLKADGSFAVPPGTSAGSVTSVALTVPSRQSVSGSPVTSTGTLAISDNNQNANLVFAGPSSGSAAAPGFRALVAADIPAQPFILSSFLSGMPAAGAMVLAVDVPADISTAQFAGNFANSVGKVGTNPTATATYTVKKNGSSVGSIAISTSGVFTFTSTSGAAVTLAAGDEITVTAPSPQDTTLADVRFTLRGTR